MRTLGAIRGQRRILAMIALLVAGYLGVYLPIRLKSAALDAPLADTWGKVIKGTAESPFAMGATPEALAASLNQLAQLQGQLAALNSNVIERTQLEEDIRSKMSEPFQLVRFQNDRQERIERLIRSAAENGVILGAQALESFPEYSAEQRQVALLWAQLAIVDYAMSVAVLAKLDEINDVILAPIQTHNPVRPGGQSLHETPIELHVKGTMDQLAKFLLAVSMTGREAAEAEIMTAPETKPAFFIDRLMIRKTSPTRTEEVEAEIRLTGFAFRG